MVKFYILKVFWTVCFRRADDNQSEGAQED